MNLSSWCTKIIRTSFYLLFILVPLILTPWNYELFEYNKMVVTYAITAAIFGAWLIQMVREGEIRVTKTPLDIPIVLFVASQLISALFSMDRHVSWFGYYSRFNGGMWSIFTYTVLYYAFVTYFGEEIIAATATVKKKANKAVSAIASLPVPVKKILNTIVATATLVSLYGIAEHVGIDKNLWVQDVQSRVFSTLGQPNWLAAFLTAVFPISLYFFAANSSRATTMQILKFLFGGFTALLFFLVILYTRSRSGLLGLGAADAVFTTFLLGYPWQKIVILPLLILEMLCFLFIQSPILFIIALIFFIIVDITFVVFLVFSALKNKTLAIPVLVFHSIFALIVFFNGTYIDSVDKWVTFRGWRDRFAHKQVAAPKPQLTPAGTALESGGTESGTIRKYVWQAAVATWRGSTKNMLIGSGTETFAFAFYQYRPVGHNLTSEWDFLYNKAHNEYLNYLATTGILGLGTYLLLIGTFIIWFIKMLHAKCQMINKSAKNSFDIGHLALDIALFSGWISILITNFFGFSVVIIQLFFFLFPATIIALTPDKTYRTWNIALINKKGSLIRWIIAAGTVTALVLLYRYWKADTLYSTGYRLARANQFSDAETAEKQAIALNPGEPVYHDELATTLASLSLAAVEAKNATIASALAKQSLAENDLAIRTSPKNVNFWKTRTKLYYTFSSFDPQLNQSAIDALEIAQTLSPNDPKIAYNLAILYGRQGNNDRAVQLLNRAKTLKPNYRDVYFGLYVFYTELKKNSAARAQLQYYLDHVDPNDKDFQSRITQ